MAGCKGRDYETWRRSLVGWLVARVRNGDCMYCGGGIVEGCKGQKLGHACNVEEKVGEAQRAERSTARNSECVDCFRSFRF